MKHLFKVVLLPLTFIMILTGCGQSVEKDLLGTWKLTQGAEKNAYIEFSEERLVIGDSSDTTPEIVDYRMTDLQKGRFMIDIAEPGTSTYVFFMEGIFEKKDKVKIIKAIDAGDETFDLIRVKDIEKEKDRKQQEKLAAKEEEERAKKDKAEEKKVEKESAKQEEKEKEKTEAEKAQNETTVTDEENSTSTKEVGEAKGSKVADDVAQDDSPKAQYLREADRLEEKITAAAIKADPNAHDLWPDFYGQYYDEWDALLNEVWGLIRDSIPANEFEQLKVDQKKWIQQKEEDFAKYPEGEAPTGFTGTDLITYQTKDRTYYLIENYLK